MAEISTLVSLTRRMVENHTPNQAHVGLNKLKIQELNAFYENWDTKEFLNFIFDVLLLEGYRNLLRGPESYIGCDQNYGGARR